MTVEFIEAEEVEITLPASWFEDEELPASWFQDEE
jgi:hypothetical protein